MFRFLQIVIFGFFCLSLTSFQPHPYHVGAVEINYNNKSKSFEITGRFFIDDLENAVSEKSGKHLQFQNKKTEKEMNEALKNYCLNALKIKANQKNISLNYLGYEEDKESVEIYMESSTTTPPKKVEVSTNFIYNLYDDQMNIIHIIVNGKRKSDRLNYPKTFLSKDF